METREEHGSFDIAAFSDELAAARRNHAVGTTLLFENDHVRIFELRLEPGERAPFHVHDRTYFWTVVDPGRGLQRFRDGTSVTRDYAVGQTKYLVHGPEDALIHDLENVGGATLRFTTVEFLR
jgi:mannose-6-phosphate isomerase-like protein (cupin superfamily)